MRILVGITGGIAAYKSAELIRLLVEAGHDVRAVPTTNALRFIGAATLEALTHNAVHHDLYSDIEDVRHIELAKWAEAIVIAPATASFLARTAAGLADDLLGNVVLASTSKLLIAPAMHTEMWFNQATVENVAKLRSRGIEVIEPASGRLTGSDSGVGRLPDPAFIFEALENSMRTKDLEGKSVLVIAGGTREPIDPVRFIGNRSSGKQGIALVEEAVARGAKVTLVAANFEYTNHLAEVFPVRSAKDIGDFLDTQTGTFDVIVMPAAISDFRVSHPSEVKLKKKDIGERLELSLIQNPDLLAKLGSRKKDEFMDVFLIGFAAESTSGESLKELAKKKLISKQLDLIVANQVSDSIGFESDQNDVFLIDQNGESRISGSKRTIAKAIFDRALKVN